MSNERPNTGKGFFGDRLFGQTIASCAYSFAGPIMTLMSPGALLRGKFSDNRPLADVVSSLIECISVLVCSYGGGWFIVTPYLLGLAVSELVRNFLFDGSCMTTKTRFNSTCVPRKVTILRNYYLGWLDR